MAYAYVKELGMNENMTLISQQDNGVKTSDKYNYMLDKEVQRILKVINLENRKTKTSFFYIYFLDLMMKLW